MNKYKVTYNHGVIVITKGNEVIRNCYELELAMVEDRLNEMQEEGILPLDYDFSSLEPING
jgi:hypothetical protein